MEKNLIEQLKGNFEEVDKGLGTKKALNEAHRCLYCYDAPCIKACPTSINIPSFIKKIASGNIKGSARVIMEANPVGASCARVCPTEELCEGACVLNSDSAPIPIGSLQRYATDWAIHNDALLFQKGENNGLKVAVIGSGPAGLSAARELARFGYSITMFEKSERAGGLNTYGIVSFRLPQKISFWEVSQVERLGVEIRTETTVGEDISAEDILSSYDFVILAAGMGSVPHLHVEGEQLEGVYDAIEFVKDTKTKELTGAFQGKKVAVIGAGNTAIDAATCSVRLCAENVKIVYRRTVKEMTAYDFEYEFAKQDGVEFRFLTAPKEIIGDEQGRVKALRCVKMKLTEPEKDGRSKPVEIEGSTFDMSVDVVIKAIGQTRHTSLIEQFGLKHEGGVVKVEERTMRTSKEGIYACGDIVFGKGYGDAMVVTAAEQGKNVAYEIHKSVTERKENLA
ncbi:NAD(P)-dependent oxidoreductase [Priestia filamentosa]|uniref:NAD(P)-dependent oxidoreductase n=1 Tax=Priestia filamentosa TaxID=1402861 RepID=UPI003F165089